MGTAWGTRFDNRTFHLQTIRGDLMCAWIRWAISFGIAAATAVVACAPPLATSPSPGGSEPTRFAMQSTGYVAVPSDGAASLQLAFADRGAAEEPAASDFSSFRWITDEGEFPAIVDSVTSSVAGPLHRLVTLASHAEFPGPGKYTVTAIEYHDAKNEQRRLRIGMVLLDVRDVLRPAPIEFPTHSIGQSRLEFIELSAHNTSSSTVVIGGLDFDLPGVDTSTAMLRVSPRQSTDTAGAPEPAPSAWAADVVVVDPGETVDLRFDVSVDDPDAVRFSELAPFMLIESDGISRVVDVPLQVYFGPFAGEDDLNAYLESLSSDSSHPL